MPSNIKEQVHQHYGNRIRVRTCGVLIQDQKILMLKHDGIGKKDYFWNVPGGGLEKGENLVKGLEREFLEETGLKIEVKKLLCLNQYIVPPLHAIEYYFLVEKVAGNAKLGHDPEMVSILSELNWFNQNDFMDLDPECKPNFLLKYLNID
ncbi:NUDIX domain-containing protein [Arcticibacterium luteifluviistationis]|uniref:NUDIX hydrolase n=1 Tax=Arcticibacterium luteifluviistationis TaxID=1784714 RepID=A0A2Z4G8G3_9BACT|nr:NUDIX hydrolase [Arcticibacterium luteifluviistationis]AWV97400.1 NUDIX hydrolase [Arcticibacterium luteifluviistationis]